MKNSIILSALKTSAIIGIISAILNSIWGVFITQSYNVIGLPEGFSIAIIISSIMPTIIGGLVFGLLAKYLSKGAFYFMLIGSVLTLLSCIPTFGSTLPDGAPTPDHFTLLTLPMHLIAGGLATFLIPKYTKA